MSRPPPTPPTRRPDARVPGPAAPRRSAGCSYGARCDRSQPALDCPQCGYPLVAPVPGAPMTTVAPSSSPTIEPGVPVIVDGQLVSTNPATGAEVARLPVAGAAEVAAAVARARQAGVVART